MTHLLSEILIWVAFPGSVAFPFMYAIYTNKRYGEAWYETDVGRHLMTFSVTVMLALLNSVILVLFRNYPGRSTVTLVLEAGVAIMVWWRVFLYIRYRFPRSKGKHHVDSDVLERRTGEMPENGGTDVSGPAGDEHTLV